jgi:hypothetical protein
MSVRGFYRRGVDRHGGEAPGSQSPGQSILTTGAPDVVIIRWRSIESFGRWLSVLSWRLVCVELERVSGRHIERRTTCDASG